MSTPVSPLKTCRNCNKTGLAILPVRYAVVPDTVNASIPAPITGKRVVDAKLSKHNYALRTLRRGHVYLFFIKGARGSNYWEIYNVAEDGTLYNALQPLPIVGVKDATACSRSGHNIPTSFIAIEKPDQCGEVQIAFSEYLWSDETLKRYKSSETERRARMQSVFPVKWTQPPTDPHAVPATKALIEKVIEYGPGSAVDSLEPKIATISQPAGTYIKSVLESRNTRYPLHLRVGQSDDLLKQMQAVGKAAPKPYQPMLLALWDAIGIAHELNGYRNDANARFIKYADERELQIDALQNIDAAHKAIEANARQKAAFAHSAAIVSGSTGWYDEAAEAKMRAAAQTPEDKQLWADREWLGSNGASSMYAKQLWTMRGPYYMQGRGDVMSRAQADTQAQKARQPARDQAIDRETAAETPHDWAPYEKKLSPGTLDKFRTQYTNIQNDTAALQAARTPDVGAWLTAQLFIDTLRDYDENNLRDGKAYETVVAEAILGLSSEAQGKQLVDQLVQQIQPTQPHSIFWAAVALNQKESKLALQQALASAKAKHQTLLDKVGEGFDVFAEAMEKLKKFSEMYEKLNKLSDQAQAASPAEVAIRNLGVDRLMVTAGSVVFKYLLVGKIGNYVGEGVIQTIFMVRAGVNSDDVRKLVIEQAHHDPLLRAQFFREFQKLRATGLDAGKCFIKASQEIADTDSSRTMRSAWSRIKASSEGEEARFSVKVSGIVLLIEMVSFAKAATKEDKSSKDYVLLSASAVSVAGALTQVISEPVKKLFGEAGKPAIALKAIGAYFGAIAGGVGAVMDIGTAIENRNNHTFISALYFGKGVTGAFGASATLLTALSSSTPLIEKLIGKNGGVIFLEKVGLSIGDAAAAKAAKAAGQDVMKVMAKRSAERAALTGAEAAAAAAAERGVILLIGRAVLFLASWEVQVGIIGIQILIWIFTPDALEEWCEKSVFGDGSVTSKYTTAEKQDKEFKKALAEVGFGEEKS